MGRSGAWSPTPTAMRYLGFDSYVDDCAADWSGVDYHTYA
jgi:hypothetical protein